MSVLRRLPLVCIEQHCRKCSDDFCPDDCEFLILHALDEDHGGLKQKPRQSGKSTDVAGVALKLVGQGHPVLVVTRTEMMKHHFKMLLGYLGISDPVLKRITIETMGSVKSGMLRGKSGLLLTDEISPKELVELNWDSKMCGYTFVMGRYTQET